MKRCMGCMELYIDDVSMCPYCGYEENTNPEEAFHLMPGTIIGKRYMVGKVLGFGGFGVTYIGFDVLLEKKVAIKEYLPSEFATRVPSQTKVSIYAGEKTEQFGQGMARFVEEARKLAKFNETSEIVNVYDCILENETAYIIMELLEGESLKSYLERNKKLSVEEAEKIILPVFKSLHSVHEEGLIHRDIAPDNIFLTTDGRVKLLDFGAARYASATHSRSLSVIYKPGYAPEEQYQSRGEQGPWTDVYALAATMYKMITGVTPDTSLERRAKDTLKPPSKLGVDISKNKETALMNALNVQVKNRTKSAEAFLEEWESPGEVARIIDTVKQLDVGKLSKKAKIAILSSVAVVGVALAVVLGMGGLERVTNGISVASGKTRVPSVVNETIDEAQVRLEDAGIQLEITGREYSSEIKKDLILHQDYKSGSLVATNQKMGVIVSGGIRQIYMPEVAGKTREEARELLETEGFLVVEEEMYSAVVTGSIIEASLTAGAVCDEGTEVIIYVSKGIDPATIEEEKKYTVEDFTGKTVEEIQTILAEAGIYLDSSQREYSDTMAAGLVISQDVEPGTELKAGNTISVVVSLGKEMIRIPDLTYKEKKEAESLLAELDLVIEWREEFNAVVKAGLVAEQSLEAGSEVDKGTTLVIVISKGPEPTATPTPTLVPTATNTPKPTPTKTPKPTATNTPKPTATNTPRPTATNTPRPTATNTPRPTATNTPRPTATNTPRPTATNTPRPTATNTPTPTPTNTPTPTPHQHDYSWKVTTTTEATCSVEGQVRYECSCGDYREEAIEKLSHTVVTDAAVAATCTTDGKTEGSHCFVCGTVIVTQEAITAKGHTEVTVSGKAATCTATGLTDGKKCSVCGTVTVKQETIAAKGHTAETVSGKAATCTATGLKDGKKCSVCGTVIVKQETIAAKGHTEVTVSGKAATCTETGLTDGKKCSACGTVTVKQSTIEAKGHSYDGDMDPYCNICNAYRVVNCTVTFNSNGGSTVSTQTVTYGTTLNSLPIPTRSQYTFDGWTYNGSIVTSVNVTGNITLTASWTPYKIQYGYYHYISGSKIAVCAYYLVDTYGVSASSITREVIWVDAPLTLTSSSATSYRHVHQGSQCTKNGCTEPAGTTYFGKYTDGSGVVWYKEQTRTVPASTSEGIER